jgi:hypothetical protein
MLCFYGFLNHTFSIVYNAIKLRNKVLLPKRRKFPAGLPILVLNLHCVMVNIRAACLEVNKHCILPTKNRNTLWNCTVHRMKAIGNTRITYYRDSFTWFFCLAKAKMCSLCNFGIYIATNKIKYWKFCYGRNNIYFRLLCPLNKQGNLTTFFV